jgi:Domain of unknown function (DUF4157)
MTEPSTARQAGPATGHHARPSPPANAHDSSPAHPLAELHGAVGNLGVLDRLPGLAIQPKLEIGAPDDEYEREADVAAAQVMRSAGPALLADADLALRRKEDDRKKPPAPPPARPAEKKMPAPPPPPPKAPPPPPKKAPTATAPVAKPPAMPKQAPPPPRLRRPEKDHVATKAAPGAVPSITPRAASTIQSQQGAGRPLSSGDRAFFEPRLGRDLGGVRLHDDSAAQSAARDIRAQAFTYGQDIYFAPSRLAPGSAGRELLAHELAHTVQQRPGARVERRVQRQVNQPTASAVAPAPPATAGAQPATPGPALPTTDGTRDGDTLRFPALEVPPFRLAGEKGADYRKPLTRAKGYKPADRRAPGMVDQRDMWRESLGSRLRPKVTGLLTLRHAQARNGRSLVKSGGTGIVPRYYIGSDLEIAQGLSTPNWDHKGHGKRDPIWVYDADHMLELQVANFPASRDAHSIGNLELLEHHINLRSGNYIKQAIERHVAGYVAALPPSQRAEFARWRENFNVTFATGIPGTGFQPAVLAENDHWTRDDIAAGAHLANVVTTPQWSEIGSEDVIDIFQSATGGIPSKLHKTGHLPDKRLLAPFILVAKTVETGEDWETKPNIASLTFELPAGKAIAGGKPPDPVPIPRLPGARFAGYLDKRATKKALLSDLKAPGMSRVEIDDFELLPNRLYAQGRIVTDLPLLEGTEIDLTLDGDDLEISKTFEAGDFKVPRPLQIDGSSLTVTAHGGDASIKGQVNLSIDRVGQGFVKGGGSIRRGFDLDGGFTFSSDIFENPHMTLGYHAGQFSGSGHLGLARGKIPGLRHGTLDVSYADGHLEATGRAQLDIPGVREAELHLSYDRDHGLTIGGTVVLGRLPGLNGGTLSVTIAQRPGEAGYRLTAHGEAEPAIPGIGARLVVDYDDGAFTAHAHAEFHRGLVAGSIDAGATNRPVGEDGRIVEDGPPTPKVAIFGSGVAALRLGLLKGTAEMHLLPDGEISVAGELDVAVNLWDPIEPDPTTLLHPPKLEFPIFGPVVLELGGSLVLRYGVGAGVLGGRLRIDYSPAHEEQTHVYGAVGLHTSAYAGLELDVFVGLSLDAWIGHISGRILVGAGLFAQADVTPAIAIDWTPGAGLSLDPVLDAHLTPKLVFHLDAVVAAGVGPFEKEWHKELARREFGSSMAMGIAVPAHYDEAHGFNVAWDRKQITYPDLDPLETAKDFLMSLV